MTSIPKTSQTGKLIGLGLFFIVWLWADLWTKDWADSQLADPRHPIAVEISKEDVGKTVDEVFSQRLGLKNSPSDEQARKHIIRLPQHESLGGDEPVFSPDSRLKDVSSIYVFWRDDRELAPRRLERSERLLVNRWLSWALPKQDAGAIERTVGDRMAEVTVTDWLQGHLRRMSDEDANAVARDGLHPIRGRVHGVAPSAQIDAECGRLNPRCVQPGETLLVQWRQIDVMGEWFKMVYAENTGAAFGLLKGADPRLRDTIFFGLTVVVFLVIVGILIRTEPRHKMALLSLTAILAGAAGNFVDRVRYGFVIDFIDMDLGFMHWPTYNVADIGISCGVVLLMIDITFNPESPLVVQELDEDEEPSSEAQGDSETAEA